MRKEKGFGKVILFFLICFMVWQHNCCHVHAAGANISIKTENATVSKGDIFYVVITITSTEEMNGFEGYFSYNQSVMKYITGGTVSSGNDDEFSVSDRNRKEGSTELKYSIQFKARRTGSSTIALKSPYVVSLAEDSSKMSVASNVLNILVVKEPKENVSLEASKEPTENPGTEDLDEGDVSDEGDNGSQPETNISDSKPDVLEEGLDISGDKTDASEEIENDSSQSGLEASPELIPSEDKISEFSHQNPVDSNSAESSFSEREQGEKGVSSILIIFLLLFSFVLFIAIIVGLFFLKRQEDEEEQWDSETDWDETEEKEVVKEEPSEETESLEEIEKRLEKKRYWLRK